MPREVVIRLERDLIALTNSNSLGVIALQNDLTVTTGGADAQSDMDADGESDWE